MDVTLRRPLPAPYLFVRLSEPVRLTYQKQIVDTTIDPEEIGEPFLEETPPLVYVASGIPKTEILLDGARILSASEAPITWSEAARLTDNYRVPEFKEPRILISDTQLGFTKKNSISLHPTEGWAVSYEGSYLPIYQGSKLIIRKDGKMNFSNNVPLRDRSPSVIEKPHHSSSGYVIANPGRGKERMEPSTTAISLEFRFFRINNGSLSDRL